MGGGRGPCLSTPASKYGKTEGGGGDPLLSEFIRKAQSLDLPEGVESTARQWICIFQPGGFTDGCRGKAVAIAARFASSLHIRDISKPREKYVHLKPGVTWPLERIAVGCSFSSTFAGEACAGDLLASTWQGTAVEHMYVPVAVKHRFSKDGCLYHASHNYGGMQLVDGGNEPSATWTYQPKDPKPEVEVWLGFNDLAALKGFAKKYKVPTLDRYALQDAEGVLLVHREDLSEALEACVDVTDVNINNKKGLCHPGITAGFLARDPETLKLTAFYGAAGVRRLAGPFSNHTLSGDTRAPVTMEHDGSQWRRIFHYDMGKSKFVYDLHKSDIVRLARVATRVRIQSHGGEKHVTSRVDADWVLENLRAGRPLSRYESGVTAENAADFWEGNMVEHMICEYDEQAMGFETLNDKLYHATANFNGEYGKKGLILFPGNSWSCWHCGHNEEPLEVWLDATEIPDSDVGAAVKPHDIFCWGSCSKSLTPALAAVVMSEMPSKLGWGSTIAKVFADDKEIMDGLDPWYHHVTVEMMCSMTSGCPDQNDGEAVALLRSGDPRHLGSYTFRNWLLTYCKLKVNSEEVPVGKFRYHSFGMGMVAAMLEKVTGKDFQLLLNEKLMGKIVAHPELPINRWSVVENPTMRYSAARNNLHGTPDALGYVHATSMPGAVWGHDSHDGAIGSTWGPVYFPGEIPGPNTLQPCCGSFSSTIAVKLQYLAFHTSFSFAHATTGVSFENWNRLHQPMVGTCNGVEVNSGGYAMCLGSTPAVPHPKCSHGGSNGHFHAFMTMFPGQGKALAQMTNGGTTKKASVDEIIGRKMQEVLDALNAKEGAMEDEIEAKETEEVKNLFEERT